MPEIPASEEYVDDLPPAAPEPRYFDGIGQIVPNGAKPGHKFVFRTRLPPWSWLPLSPPSDAYMALGDELGVNDAKEVTNDAAPRRIFPAVPNIGAGPMPIGFLVRRSILLLAGTALMSTFLAGCSAQVTQQMQVATAEDQAAAVAVANAAKDYDMQLCTGAMSSIASVPCPIPGPACRLVKAYEVEQATAHSCAAVEANAKAAFGQLLINLRLVP